MPLCSERVSNTRSFYYHVSMKLSVNAPLKTSSNTHFKHYYKTLNTSGCMKSTIACCGDNKAGDGPPTDKCWLPSDARTFIPRLFKWTRSTLAVNRGITMAAILWAEVSTCSVHDTLNNHFYRQYILYSLSIRLFVTPFLSCGLINVEKIFKNLSLSCTVNQARI